MDCFIDSFVVYQGLGRGLDKLYIKWFNDYVIDSYKFDLILYFDVFFEVGLECI